VAREADGSVKFGQGEGSAYLFDPDIYTDGRISVQGIDAVLLPPDDTKTAPAAAPERKPPAVTSTKKSKLRRGQHLQIWTWSFRFRPYHAIIVIGCSKLTHHIALARYLALKFTAHCLDGKGY
jgi:hypothetical protein